MRIIVGDEVGLIKSISFNEPATGKNNTDLKAEKRKKSKKDAEEKLPPYTTMNLIGQQNRNKAIDLLCFATKNKSKAVAATKDGHVMVLELETGVVETEFRVFEPVKVSKGTVSGNKAREEEHFVGLFESNGTIITCTSKGNVQYHERLEYLTPESTSSSLPSISTNIGQDALTVMKVFPESPSYFATAGAEREVCLWRIVSDQETGTAKLESIWKARNVANDHLDLRVPVHVTDLQFLPPPADYKPDVVVAEGGDKEGSVKPTRIAMVSLHKHFRIYDVYGGKRRPSLSVTVGDMPAKRLAVTKDGSEAIVTDTTGTAIHIETKTGTRIGAFKGFQGAVTAIECVDEKDDALLVTAGIDRMLRVYLREGKRSLLHKIYLKHRLHTFIVDETYSPPSTSGKSKKKTPVEGVDLQEGVEGEEEDEEENDEDFFARMAEPDEDDDEEVDNNDDEEEVVMEPKRKRAPAGSTNSSKSKKRKHA